MDQHGRPRWHDIWQGNPAILRRDGWPSDYDHTIINGPYVRPYYRTFSEQDGWTFNPAFAARDVPAKIYLSDAERDFAWTIRRTLGPFILIDPWSKHENLRWPIDHWQALVRSRPDWTFVQHMAPMTPAVALLHAPNVHLVETTFRQATALCVHADVYVRGESGMLHACAAVGGRSVAIWGGCMNWEVLGGYPGQLGVGIVTPACGSWRPCAHCAAIMRGIQPGDVETAIRLQLTSHD